MEHQGTPEAVVAVVAIFAALLALWALSSVWSYQPEVVVIESTTVVNQTIVQPTIERETTNTVVEKMVGYEPVADCITVDDPSQADYTLRCYNRP